MRLRYLVAMVAWAIAGLVALWFAAETKVGPVVVVFDAWHGLHEGDLIVFVACLCAATLVTVAAFWPTGSRSS